MSAVSGFRRQILPIAIFAAAAGPGPVGADDAVPLAVVATDLGYAYAYLPVENAVSLTRHGTTIVVRPGDSFFSINARREPVYGMVPTYRDNDVVVSRAFEREIRPPGERPARRLADRSWPNLTAGSGASAGSAPNAATGTVTMLGARYVASEGAVRIVGRATPGSLVTLVLRGYLAEDMPVITLDDSAATADSHGRFETSLDSAPVWFQYAHFIVEASAPGDTFVTVATVVDTGTNPVARTRADDALDH